MRNRKNSKRANELDIIQVTGIKRKARKLHNVNGVLVHKNISKIRKGKLYKKGTNASKVPSGAGKGGEPGGRGGGLHGGGGTLGCMPQVKEEDI